MRDILKFYLLLFALQAFCISLAAQPVEIIGKIDSAVMGDKNIILSIYHGSDTRKVATTKMDSEGNFNFSLESLTSGLYEIGLEGAIMADVVISNESKLNIKSNLIDFEQGIIEIPESRENEAFNILRVMYSKFSTTMDSLAAVSQSIEVFDPKKKSKHDKVQADRTLAIKRFNQSVRFMTQLYPKTYSAEVLSNVYFVPEYDEFPTYSNEFDNNVSFRHLHFFEYVDFSDPRILTNPLLEAKYFQYLNDYTTHSIIGFQFAVDLIMTKAAANAEVKSHAFEYLVNVFNRNGPEELVSYLNEKYYNDCEAPVSEETQELLQQMETLKPGNTAPDLSLNNFNYKPINLSSIEGKVKMIYFWASWCDHCKEETPFVYKVYEQYKDKGFNVYAVSLDNEYSEWVTAIQQMGLNWTNVSELKGWTSESSKVYNIQRTPTIILLDSENKIIERDISLSELERKLLTLLQ